MKEVYQACIQVCSIRKDIYAVPEKSRKNIEHRNGFLYVQNLNEQWWLILPRTFNAEGKNLLEIAIAQAHTETAHGGIKQTMKALTDKFEYRYYFRLVKQYVKSCNICQRTKYGQKGTIRYKTPLQQAVRPCSDITMDFLKLLAVVTKFSVLYRNIPVGEDHIVCISWLRTIVDR